MSFAPVTISYLYISQVLREKVFLPEVSSLRVSELCDALQGDAGGNLSYIRELTGALLVLRGEGTDAPSEPHQQPEQLHFYIE